MKDRCNISNVKGYSDRGITVCDRWQGSFLAFLEDMGRRPSDDHSLGRIDNDGNYCKNNCEWQTRTEQGNNKRNNRTLTYRGVTMTVMEWSRKTGINHDVIYQRIYLGWPAARILTAKVLGSYSLQEYLRS
jgi:hypothetical protein